MVKLGSNGGTVFELIVSAVIIFIIVSVFGMHAAKIVAEAKEVALRSELLNLRLGLEVYKIRNGRMPKGLFELCQKRDYFVCIDREGDGDSILDPFGASYTYNPGDGTIMSGTDKYKDL